MRLAALAVLAVPTLAFAQPPGMTPAATTPSEDAEWIDVPAYRLQTALVDGAALGMALFAAKSEGSGNVLGVGALVTYGLGAPLVHMAHHQYARAAQSLGLRIGLPLLGVVVGGALGKNACSAGCDNDSDIAGAAFGALVGAVTASVIDIAYLSRGDKVEATTAPPVAATAGFGSSQFSLGVGGTF